MTSNLGAEFVSNPGIKFKEARVLVENLIKKRFPPEFLNRIDETIVFVSAEAAVHSAPP